MENVAQEFRCVACNEWYAPDSNRQKLCKTCAPSKGWVARYRRYKITKPQYDELIERQEGKCALCQCILLHDIDTCVDHCHNSLEVRGILCRGCNMVVARFEDMEYFNRVALYLKGGLHCG